jgi:hypothetical protein
LTGPDDTKIPVDILLDFFATIKWGEDYARRRGDPVAAAVFHKSLLKYEAWRKSEREKVRKKTTQPG